MKTLVSHGNAHQMVTSAEEEFNNQVDSTIHSEGSQPLPKPFLSLPDGPMNKVALVADMGLYMDLTIETSTNQG